MLGRWYTTQRIPATDLYVVINTTGGHYAHGRVFTKEQAETLAHANNDILRVLREPVIEEWAVQPSQSPHQGIWQEEENNDD